MFPFLTAQDTGTLDGSLHRQHPRHSHERRPYVEW
jgi:hypothetical protein